ncbi:hypothetical protein SBI_05451 [Streptomyces bingchenggensis BCW-1]|uniref:Secreted protein n=1 Tax=Streptomyces bingchenggensis (strain BCW-1) TaxID=749414 RepID=D7CAK4_STRBB|nr:MULTISPECIES: hypothetical protein [Streptomyces]ADI08571.1 hypothetical protein SBI_05451 [Streptomyces bingchenggensis BCW-1]
MRITRAGRTRNLVVAALAGSLLAGGAAVVAGDNLFTTDASAKPADTIANAAAEVPRSAAEAAGCKTYTSHWEVRNHIVNIKTADIKIRITRCLDSSGALTPSSTTRIFATTTTAGDLLYGVTATPETAPAIVKATDSQYVLQQDVEHKTCLGTKYGPWCDHNNITFTITMDNRKGLEWQVSAKDTSRDDDIVAA